MGIGKKRAVYCEDCDSYLGHSEYGIECKYCEEQRILRAKKLMLKKNRVVRLEGRGKRRIAGLGKDKKSTQNNFLDKNFIKLKKSQAKKK